jgi:hypothetical protein
MPCGVVYLMKSSPLATEEIGLVVRLNPTRVEDGSFLNKKKYILQM